MNGPGGPADHDPPTPTHTLAFTLKAVRGKIATDLCHRLHTWPLAERGGGVGPGEGIKRRIRGWGGGRWSCSGLLVPAHAGKCTREPAGWVRGRNPPLTATEVRGEGGNHVIKFNEWLKKHLVLASFTLGNVFSPLVFWLFFLSVSFVYPDSHQGFHGDLKLFFTKVPEC